MSSSSSSAALPGALRALADDPVKFLGEKVIVFSPVSVPQEYRSDDGSSFRSGRAGVKLVQSPKDPQKYDLQFVAINDLRTDRNAVNAFVLAYKKNSGNDVPFVDIPIRAYNENTFLFTVGLTGCSVIVTRLDDNTYRVFHDRRMDSAVLYNDVQMYTNFDDYRIGGHYLSHTGSAITLMLFQGGVWKMFLQRQPPQSDTREAKCEAHAVQQTRRVTTISLWKAFENRRDILQKRVKSNGRNLDVVDNLLAQAVDGVVEGPEYNEQAITGWNDLRTAIRNRIDDYHLNYHLDPDTNRKLKGTYERFTDNNSESKQMDETWIWFKIRGP